MLDCFSHQIALSNFRNQADKKLFINVHPKTLYQPDNLFLLINLYENVDQVVVEITEQEKLDIALLREVFDICKDTGVKVALDDFGAGYNQIHLLNHITPDFIKLDRFFTKNAKDHKHKLFIEEVVNWSKTNGVDIIAEGIESIGDLTQIKEMGIKKGQGWLLGRPEKHIKRNVPSYLRSGCTAT